MKITNDVVKNLHDDVQTIPTTLSTIKTDLETNAGKVQYLENCCLFLSTEQMRTTEALAIVEQDIEEIRDSVAFLESQNANKENSRDAEVLQLKRELTKVNSKVYDKLVISGVHKAISALPLLDTIFAIAKLMDFDLPSDFISQQDLWSNVILQMQSGAT